MKKRAVLSAGGTGGHLFPAQSLAESLPDWEILFVAGGLATNRYFDRARFPYKEISCATFSLKNPFQVLSGAGKICSGVVQSRSILREFKPDVVIGFGSFFTLPVLSAAAIERLPIVLHEQNAIPGKVNRLFAYLAHTTTITFPDTRTFLPKKAAQNAVEVIFPQRKRAASNADEAWDYFGLQPCEKPLLLIFGGSQGAARLNHLLLEALEHLPAVQVLHFTGTEERADEARAKYYALGITACVKAFEPRIDLAMKIADCAITRAGAATVCELIDNVLPALLIPFPFAAENHQEKNAEHFVNVVGGGKMCPENRLNANLMADQIRDLLEQKMLFKEKIISYKNTRLVKQLADLIKEITP